jgi:hypothetical protein
LREGALKLEEQKTTLEGMIQSRDELIMEMAEEYGLNRLGEDDEDEDEDDDDKENATAPPTPVPPAAALAPLWIWFLSKRSLWHMR